VIMRLVSFFALSLALHATALVYPVSFGGHSQAQFIQVTILPMEQEGGGTGGREGNGMPVRRSDSKSQRATPPAVEPGVEPKSPPHLEPEVLPSRNIASATDSSIALVSTITNSAETVGAAISGPAGNDANDLSTGLGEIGTGNGLGSFGNGLGQGSGNSNGSGSGPVVALTQASYRDTPSPSYPESARRDGREGRVLLRVLVDHQGRIKQVDINSSSGSDVLDHAAAEAIKRWRFHPARYGDKPVESWLRIPIEFRLADAKPW